MATLSAITTGEQNVTATGAVTGSLNTAALTGDYTIQVRVRNFTGTKMMIAVEDTANASAFSDALQVGIFHITTQASGIEASKSWKSYEIPCTRFGVTNSKLRLNVLSYSGGGSAQVIGELYQ